MERIAGKDSGCQWKSSDPDSCWFTEERAQLSQETGYEVPGRDLLHSWLHYRTIGLGRFATRVKIAAGRRIEWTGYLSSDGDVFSLALNSGIGNRNSGKQDPGIGMEWIMMEFHSETSDRKIR